MGLHTRNIHWLAPTTMVLALLGSATLALGHHLFYASLNGQEVPAGSYRLAGKSIHKQQINTAVGLTMALLIRTFLSIAVSIACVQVFWRSLRNEKQSPTLSELDWAFSMLDNVFKIFYVKSGWKYPLFVSLAIVFWCVPIATIFTPGTLSVRTASVAAYRSLSVPQFDFTTLNFAAGLDPLTTVYYDYYWNFAGPSYPLQKLASTAMTFGQILPISPPAPNASWTLNFSGPALRCNDVAIAEQDKIWVSIWNSYSNTSQDSPDTFLSWLARSPSDPDILNYSEEYELPFLMEDVYHAAYMPPVTSSVPAYGPASLFIAVLPEMGKLSFRKTWTLDEDGNDSVVTNVWFLDGKGDSDASCPFEKVQSIADPITYPTNSSGCSPNPPGFTLGSYFMNSTLLRCNFVNTSYDVSFNYSSGAQDIQIISETANDASIINITDYFVSLSYAGRSGQSDCKMFAAYPNDSFIEDSSIESNNEAGFPCTFDASAMRLLSYQGIMGAFNELILGSIKSGQVSTSILRTVLAQTTELTSFQIEDNKNDLQWLISNNASRLYPGLVKSQLPVGRGDLQSTLEELFRNFTISLLAEPYLQPNYSSPFAPPELANVSISEYQTLYEYDSETLWLAYGTSLFFAMLVVTAGILAIWLNGASYSNSFSTVFRISQAAELSVEVLEQDRSGQDPLPKYLKHARLELDTRGVLTEVYGRPKATADQQSLVSSSGKSLPPIPADDDSELDSR